MLLFKIALELFRILNSIYDDLKKWRYTQNGRKLEREEAREKQKLQIQKAKAARLNSRDNNNTDSGGVRENDPYLRD